MQLKVRVGNEWVGVPATTETADGYYRVPIYENGENITQKWSDEIKIEKVENE